MEPGFSKQELMRFTEFVSDKGLVKYQTARGWRTAISKLLQDLSEAEDTDVRRVDVDLAVHRTANRTSDTISPDSLKTYKSRVTTAIEEFLAWKEDPENYKPRALSKQKTTKKIKRSPSQKSTAQSSETVQQDRQTQTSRQKEVITQSHGLNLSYPLRADFLAQVVVPRDMNELEAKRLGAFILTLATDFQPE